jgi:hypothetical protein
MLDTRLLGFTNSPQPSTGFNGKIEYSGDFTLQSNINWAEIVGKLDHDQYDKRIKFLKDT